MYKATVSGSFRRHLAEVQAAIFDLRIHGVTTLSPSSTVVVGEEGGFTFLATDPSLKIRETEESHLKAIERSDFLWIVCPDGQLGTSTLFEIGYAAVGLDKLIFCLNQVVDAHDGLTNVGNLVTVVQSIDHALRLVEKRRDEARKFFTLLPGFRS